MNEISVILPASEIPSTVTKVAGSKEVEEMNLYHPINRHCAIHSYLSDTEFQNGAFYDSIILCVTSDDLRLVVDHYLKYHPFGIVFIEGDESIIPAGIRRVRVSHESQLIGAAQRLYNMICI